MRRYLRQLGTFLAPRSVDAADSALRQLARWMITEANLGAVGDIRRDDIEDYKVWLAAQPRGGGQTITAETHRQRMWTVRQFFERITRQDWPGAPPRNPVIVWDIPKNTLEARIVADLQTHRAVGLSARIAGAWGRKRPGA